MEEFGFGPCLRCRVIPSHEGLKFYCAVEPVKHPERAKEMAMKLLKGEKNGNN